MSSSLQEPQPPPETVTVAAMVHPPQPPPEPPVQVTAQTPQEGPLHPPEEEPPEQPPAHPAETPAQPIDNSNTLAEELSSNFIYFQTSVLPSAVPY